MAIYSGDEHEKHKSKEVLFKDTRLRSLKNLGLHKLNGVGSPQRSMNSFSRVRLNHLAREQNWSQVEDFGINDPRDGVFDAIYSTPLKPCSDSSAYETKRSFKLPSIVQLWPIRRISEAIPDKQEINRYFWPVMKFFIAFFSAFLICTIKPANRWLGGRYSYFLPISVLLHHPVRTVGFQIEMTVQSIIGGGLGLGWSALAWYISTATRPAASHQGGVLFASLFLALLWSTFIKSLYRRLIYLCFSFSSAVVFLHTVDLADSFVTLKWKRYWDFGIPFLFGLILSLLVCIIVVPRSGTGDMIREFDRTLSSVSKFLVAIVDPAATLDEEAIWKTQREMTKASCIGMSQIYREYVNQITFSFCSTPNLSHLRNSLTNLVNSLRILPISHKLLDNLELERLYSELDNREEGHDNFDSKLFTESTMNKGRKAETLDSVNMDDISRDESELPRMRTNCTHIEKLKDTFSRDAFRMIFEMLLVLEDISALLTSLYNHKKVTPSAAANIDILSENLKKKIYNLDVCYRDFVDSDYFNNDLLSDTDSVDCFLFLRYLRNSAKCLVETLACTKILCTERNWHVSLPNYPLHRALKRLPRQSTLDEGAGNVLHYFETQRDVEEIFERLYNSYTSRHHYQGENAMDNRSTAVRAIDHKDFNFHRTQNPWRYHLWELSTVLTGPEMKWSIKILFVMIFLCLPAWLPQSYKWYQEYQCWWCPLSFYMLAHRRYSGTWSTPIRRLGYGLMGMFWGWAANQARHFGSPYVLCTFCGLFLVPFVINFLVYKNTKSSFTALLCFTVISLKPYSKGTPYLNTARIWKETWVTSIALIIAITLSITVNWVVWSFRARSELRKSMSSLIGYLCQSYQTVTDRYLYRDHNDAPTELTLALSNIREVRLTQNLEAVKELYQRAENEPSLLPGFDPLKYKRLIDTCEVLLEKVIEARISGQHFEVWEDTIDGQDIKKLMMLRRDSVATVIFIFCIIANCFRSKNKLPRYLPNAILTRKKLYDCLDAIVPKQQARPSFKSSSLTGAQLNNGLKSDIEEDSSTGKIERNYLESTHWTEVHGIAFSRAYTDITEITQDMIQRAKDILGEESF